MLLRARLHFLHSGLIASGKVDVAANREVSGALVAAGWSQRTLGHRDSRYRAWVSPSWALPVERNNPVPVASAPFVNPFDPSRFDKPEDTAAIRAAIGIIGTLPVPA
jgi:hypothetical protein